MRGRVKSLGADCIEKEMRDEHQRELLRQPAEAAGLAGEVDVPSSAATARRASSTISISTTPDAY